MWNTNDRDQAFSIRCLSRLLWHKAVSPAYDLTYSYSLNGEHATTINGEGQNPGLKDLTAVAKNIGISESTAKAVAFDVHDCVKENLSKYFT